MQYGFNYMQAPDGGSIYLRLSTRTMQQLQRDMTPQLRDNILQGAYWHDPPTSNTKVCVYAFNIIPSYYYYIIKDSRIIICMQNN